MSKEMDYAKMSPAEVRDLIRRQKITGPTTGMCDGYAQGNLVVLPKGAGLGFSPLLSAQSPPLSPAGGN